MVKKSALVKFLQDRRTRLECREGVFDAFFPFGVRQVAPERDSAAAPAKWGETANFQEKIAVFLAEFRSLAPVVNFQTWNDCMLGQGSRIEQPGIGNYFL